MTEKSKIPPVILSEVEGRGGTVLVTGACGEIGQALVQGLAKQQFIGSMWKGLCSCMHTLSAQSYAPINLRYNRFQAVVNDEVAPGNHLRIGAKPCQRL